MSSRSTTKRSSNNHGRGHRRCQVQSSMKKPTRESYTTINRIIHYYQHTQRIVPVQPSAQRNIVSTTNISAEYGESTAEHSLCNRPGG